jgi:hypothetical protein
MQHPNRYDPNQPRVPAGYHGGGQWADGKDRQLAKLRTAFASLNTSLQPSRSVVRPHVRGTIQLAAAWSWIRKLRAAVAQPDLFGGAVKGTPWMPAFRGKETFGVLQTPGRPDKIFISGDGGPTSMMPKHSPGFDINTRTHVEGHAAATMRYLRINRATLYINNPEICEKCIKYLPKMLPPNAILEVVLPNGHRIPFKGLP